MNGRRNKTIEAAREAIAGKRKGIRALIPFLGPGVIVSMAYIDPGNYATNIEAGSKFGYNLLWVVVLGSLMAILFQNLSAKLGIATGKNLPEMCRDHFPKWIPWSMWILSEIAAMANGFAGFMGAALGLNLLFHIPMLAAALMTGMTTYLILMLDRFGFRPLERFMTALALVIGVSFIIETFLLKPDFTQIAYHSLVPWIGNSESIILIVGIIGAMVDPNAVYLHSGLTQKRIVPRNDTEKIRIGRFTTIELIIAMAFTCMVNLAIMFMASAIFHSTGNNEITDIQSAFLILTPLLGSAAAGIFVVSLLTASLSSSIIDTMAGQVIMQGFVGFTIPIWLRRVITMLPAFIIIASGVDPTQSIVLSQVVLSIILPTQVIALIYFTRRKDIMGVMTNKPIINILSIFCGILVLALNLLLIYQTVGGSLPFG
ncbi:manganese transport protein [Paenibacillus sp. yr247]|uniref:Nramp family divalent metal transporter n=1 Tax=Paenibacillus sp. yr247 TaxID=1761880 RepID=UPI00087FAD7A|nr:Nramp family divalent metal transporter [Paenibacillus sp. yr247]SDO85458.1 manganese transport protein [Paenibacillus sp. yr247]